MPRKPRKRDMAEESRQRLLNGPDIIDPTRDPTKQIKEAEKLAKHLATRARGAEKLKRPHAKDVRREAEAAKSRVKAMKKRSKKK